MLKSATAQSIAAMTAAALVAGAVALLRSAVPEAKAQARTRVVIDRPVAKVERPPPPRTGSACSSRSWPNYDAGCQFDRRKPANEAKAVRRVIRLR